MASFLALPAYAGDLKLTIKGVRSTAGQLMIGIYDSEDRWKDALANSARIGLLNDKGRLLGVTMRAKPGSQSVEFPDLPLGRYAVIVFHDENDNGLLDKNGLGIPIEGYGFSNNATGFFSAPSFDDAAITVGRGQASNSISLGY